MINEVDADTPGSDTAEFVELYDGGVGNTPLDGLVVVFFNGDRQRARSRTRRSTSTATAPTRMATSSWGIPASRAPAWSFDPGDFGLLQNGADAVALYIGNASDFPNGTVAHDDESAGRHRLRHRRSERSGSAATAECRPDVRSTKTATGNGQTQSSQRCPNGMGGSRNTSTYYPGAPTPGAANTCPRAAAAERRRDQPDLWRRRQRRRHVSQRLRRAVQPRHERRRPHRLVAAVRVGDRKRLGLQQAAAGRHDRCRRVLPDRAGVGRSGRRRACRRRTSPARST